MLFRSGLEKLRSAFSRRKKAIGASALLFLLSSQQAHAAPPVALASITAAVNGTAAPLSHIVALAQGGKTMFFIAKMKMIAAVAASVLVISGAAVSGAVLSAPTDRNQPNQTPVSARQETPSQPVSSPVLSATAVEISTKTQKTHTDTPAELTTKLNQKVGYDVVNLTTREILDLLSETGKISVSFSKEVIDAPTNDQLVLGDWNRILTLYFGQGTYRTAFERLAVLSKTRIVEENGQLVVKTQKTDWALQYLGNNIPSDIQLKLQQKATLSVENQELFHIMRYISNLTQLTFITDPILRAQLPSPVSYEVPDGEETIDINNTSRNKNAKFRKLKRVLREIKINPSLNEYEGFSECEYTFFSENESIANILLDFGALNEIGFIYETKAIVLTPWHNMIHRTISYAEPEPIKEWDPSVEYTPLQRKIAVNFIDCPLNEAFIFIEKLLVSDANSIKIVIDQTVVEKGLDKKTVTLRINDWPAHRVISWLLKMNELELTQIDNVIRVHFPSDANAPMNEKPATGAAANPNAKGPILIGDLPGPDNPPARPKNTAPQIPSTEDSDF